MKLIELGLEVILEEERLQKLLQKKSDRPIDVSVFPSLDKIEVSIDNTERQYNECRRANDRLQVILQRHPIGNEILIYGIFDTDDMLLAIKIRKYLLREVE
jgi:hypothetical protein